jgi:RNA polymerase sigma factor (sigma-70 family)
VRQLAEHLRGLAESEGDEPGLESCDLANLHRCIRELPERSRSIVELHYFNGLSSRETGGELEMKPDTVCRAMSRVRNALRQCLRKANIQSMPHV